jgi:hypothetical protein
MGHLFRNWLYCVGFETISNGQKARNVVFALSVTAQQAALGSSPRAEFALSMELRTASMRMPLPCAACPASRPAGVAERNATRAGSGCGLIQP